MSMPQRQHLLFHVYADFALKQVYFCCWVQPWQTILENCSDMKENWETSVALGCFFIYSGLKWTQDLIYFMSPLNLVLEWVNSGNRVQHWKVDFNSCRIGKMTERSFTAHLVLLQNSYPQCHFYSFNVYHKFSFNRVHFCNQGLMLQNIYCLIYSHHYVL
jgi:hypothetical protein